MTWEFGGLRSAEYRWRRAHAWRSNRESLLWLFGFERGRVLCSRIPVEVGPWRSKTMPRPRCSRATAVVGREPVLDWVCRGVSCRVVCGREYVGERMYVCVCAHAREHACTHADTDQYCLASMAGGLFVMPPHCVRRRTCGVMAGNWPTMPKHVLQVSRLLATPVRLLRESLCRSFQVLRWLHHRFFRHGPRQALWTRSRLPRRVWSKRWLKHQSRRVSRPRRRPRCHGLQVVQVGLVRTWCRRLSR